MIILMSDVCFQCSKLRVTKETGHEGGVVRNYFVLRSQSWEESNTRMLGNNIQGRDSSKARAPAMAGMDAQGTERLAE